MIIAIRTRGRWGNQKTLDLLPAEWKETIHVWCPQGELPFHKRERYFNKAEHWHNQPVLGAAGAWQTIMDWAVENNEDWVWSLDDDITRFDYWASKEKEKHQLVRSGPKEIEDMAYRIYDFFGQTREGYPVALVGIMNRSGNNRVFPETEDFAARIYACWAVHIPTLVKIGFRFDEFGPEFSMEDFHCQLCLLEAGYLSMRIQDYTWDQSATNAAGGCSLYRDRKQQDEFAEILARTHPRTVRVRSKKTINLEWKDVTVRWKDTLNPIPAAA